MSYRLLLGPGRPESCPTRCTSPAVSSRAMTSEIVGFDRPVEIANWVRDSGPLASSSSTARWSLS